VSPSPAVTIEKDNFIYSNHVAGGFVRMSLDLVLINAVTESDIKKALDTLFNFSRTKLSKLAC